jgi:hypothetical protein
MMTHTSQFAEEFTPSNYPPVGMVVSGIDARSSTPDD